MGLKSERVETLSCKQKHSSKLFERFNLAMRVLLMEFRKGAKNAR